MSLCQCECGEQKIINNYCLFSKNSRSCGCTNGHNENNKIKNGDVFEFLTVIDANNYHLGENLEMSSKCKCKCGKEIVVRNGSLRTGNTTSCGCRKISVGETHIEEYLLKKNIFYKKQYKFPDLKGFKNGTLFFDFAVFHNNELKFLIEYQGKQHYEPIDFFGKEEGFKS